MGHRTKRSDRRRATVLALFVGSAAAHAAVVAFVDVTSPLGEPTAARDEVATAPPIDWTFTCDADAALAAAVRVGACASPFGATSDTCVADSLARFTVDRDQCRAPRDVEIAFVDVDQLDLMPIPLLEDVEPTDDVVAAQLIEEEVARKLEDATKPLDTPKPTGQIIEVTRPDVEVAPDNARYLSEYDTKVDKQTVARGSTEEMVARPQPKEVPPVAKAPEPPPDSAPAPKEGLPGKAGEPSPSMLAMRDPSRDRVETPATEAKSGAPGERGPEQLASIDGLERPRGEGGMGGMAAAGEAGASGGEGGEGGIKPVDLRPSQELLERTVGGGSVDHIDDAERGDFTALNSRKWKYAGFFNRMKRQVAQNWHPDSVYLRRDPTGSVYGTKDRITVLQVSLTPTGQVAKVFVAQQSGVDFLDDEAIRAFREAQPFPNPPSGLVDARSNLITFSFGFHFQIGGDRSKWRIFRQQ